jgi:hypothetical protein
MTAWECDERALRFADGGVRRAFRVVADRLFFFWSLWWGVALPPAPAPPSAITSAVVTGCVVLMVLLPWPLRTRGVDVTLVF